MFTDATQYTPPINNLLQPDIYNRLDAETIEKTRVVNTQLDERLKTQQRILAKYKIAAERFHKREKARVQDELSRITTKLPAARRINDFRNKFLYGDPAAERRKLKAAARKRDRANRRHSEPDVAAGDAVDGVGGGDDVVDDHDHENETGMYEEAVTSRRMRPTPWWDREEHPFCERYFIHHLPTKRKYYKTRTPSPLPYIPVPEERANMELGGGGGGGGGGGHGGDTSRTASMLAVSNGHNGHKISPAATPTTLPLLNLPELKIDGAGKNELNGDASLAAGDELNEGHNTPGMDVSMNGLHLDDAEPGASNGDMRGETEDKFGTPHSTPGRRRKRKETGGRSVSGMTTERALTLPPIKKQNIRLSQSSPQLYHG